MAAAQPAAVADRHRLSAALRQAQHSMRHGEGTLLDALLREPHGPALLPALRPAFGIDVLGPADAVPDFALLDPATARQWRCVVVRVSNNFEDTRPRLAAADPCDEVLLQRASRRAGVALVPAAISAPTLAQWLKGGDATPAPRAAPAAAPPLAPAAAAAAADPGAAGPAVALVGDAVRRALELGASDVHFECDRSGLTIKLRLDGVMVPHTRAEGTRLAEEAISRIKVLAQLDITERRLPQDGRFRFTAGDSAIDLRVSIMPSVFGEDAVLRLLDKAQLRGPDAGATLDALGLAPAGARRIRQLAAQPSGMVLITGPTGSGKTTTVYAALSEINSGLEKIITIEDPVEYELPGVLQIPVNERKGLTFARGLRSILRHDPDRILIGEIRDAETAEIAVQSALTGHLVFTTVHANGVADIMGRFRHFGIDMFGFMSSLNGVVVQRLLRRLCPHCTGWAEASTEQREWLAAAAPDALAPGGMRGAPMPRGCGQCHHSGYRGRLVLAEVHAVDDALRDLVTEGAPMSALKRHVYGKDVQPLQTQAVLAVLGGSTTIEEVQRVVGGLAL